MIKLLTLLLCLCCSPSQATEAPPRFLSTWGGLDSYHDSAKISDNDASDLSNVLTDRGFLEKRPGSELFQTLLDGYAVQYLGEFVSPSKTRYLIAHASSTVYYTDTSAAFVFLSTTTLSYNLDCTSAFGKLYCADGFAQPWSWNGTSTSTAAEFPVCTYLEFADERIYCANTSDGDSRVNVSAFGDPTDWTVPTTLTADSANLFTFQRTDGEGITCFRSTPWGKFIGKRHSTHILKGYDNDSYYKRIIDPEIGCIDDRSVQMVDGVLMWMGLDGVYAWSGSGKPLLISQEIDDDIKSARVVSSNKASWLNSTQADWEAGSLTASGAGAPISATITPGSITPSSWTAIQTDASDWERGTLSNIDTMTIPGTIFLNNRAGTSVFDDFSDLDFSLPTWSVAGGSWSASDGTAKITNASAGELNNTTFTWSGGGINFDMYQSGSDYLQVTITHGNDYVKLLTNTGGYGTILRFQNLSGTYDICTSATAPPAGTLSNFFISYLPDIKWRFITSYGINCTFSGSDGNPFTVGDDGTRGIQLRKVSGAGTSPYWDNIKASYDNVSAWVSATTATYTSEIFNTGLSTPVPASFEVTMSTPVGTSIFYYVRTSTSPNNDQWGAWEASSDTLRMTTTQQYWQYKADFSTAYSTHSPSIDDITLIARTTAEYYSQISYVGVNITEWLTFDANESLDGGSVSYYTRASTGSFSALSSTPAWVAQTNHLQVAASTGSYYQWKALFNVPSGTNAVTINDVTTNWQEGSGVPVASMVWDHRYHLCLINSTSSVINDRCYVLQKNNKWTHFDGPYYGSLGIFNNEPIAGDGGTNGKIYKIMKDGLYNDDGSAIDSYWVTKDFTAPEPGAQLDLKEAWIDAAYESGVYLDVGYALNKNTVFTSTSTSLSDTTNYVVKRVENLVDGYASGRYVKLRYGNDTINKYFRLNTSTIYMDYHPLRGD